MATYFGVSDAALKVKLTGVLQRAGLEDGDFWDEIVPDANRAAHDDIRDALAARGYMPEQIAGWDSRTTYQTDIALFWALTKGGCTQNYSDTFIKSLDRREQLKTIPVIVADEVITPDPSDLVPKVGLGKMKGPRDLVTECDLTRINGNW